MRLIDSCQCTPSVDSADGCPPLTNDTETFGRSTAVRYVNSPCASFPPARRYGHSTVARRRSSASKSVLFRPLPSSSQKKSAKNRITPFCPSNESEVRDTDDTHLRPKKAKPPTCAPAASKPAAGWSKALN
ncbi:hypothetical protein ZHAS_00013116 [Anopheles sinensis]|uniref:Uncharacterized protein n=1 Tax=Anopheles sinensis TaxID=74873 RepID=A0A084W4L6_ANOSI|nr:hypothetical protein ZHAS_00013116 [Anopheles sinensis]